MHTIRFGGFLEPVTTMPLVGYILVENYYADACLRPAEAPSRSNEQLWIV